MIHIFSKDSHRQGYVRERIANTTKHYSLDISLWTEEWLKSEQARLLLSPPLAHKLVAKG